VIADIIAVVAIGGSLEHGRCITVADPKVMQIGYDRLAIGELKSAVKLNPVRGRRDTHRIFSIRLEACSPASSRSARELKNPTTSVTGVRGASIYGREIAAGKLAHGSYDLRELYLR
jgi:hypothetical protein